jgi:dihydroorotate dehydrogenase
MRMYPLLKKCLFSLDPECAHKLAKKSLWTAHALGLTRFLPKVPERACTVMGLCFPNRVGLAAGFDNNGDYLDALATLGFGFIEVGGVTPKPQVGNAKPRLFRLTEQEAIINRMGFANKGVAYLAQRLEKSHYRGILGIQIVKNKETALEHAIDDYLFCYRHLWKYASYFTINVSSPNTPGLRSLQQRDFLNPLLATLKQEQQLTLEREKKYIPLVVKIAPDLSTEELNELAQVLLQQKMDGVIATNTTLQRTGVETSPYAKEAGGLSGRPLQARSTQVIRELHAVLGETIPIIASGGVIDKAAAEEKIAAGASLLQVYSGLIYRGISVVKEFS